MGSLALNPQTLKGLVAPCMLGRGGGGVRGWGQ